MKKVIASLVIVMAVFAATSVKAQFGRSTDRYAETDWHASIGLEGQYLNKSPFNGGFGLSGKVQYDINTNVSLTGSIGYLRLLNKTSDDRTPDVGLIPIKGGAKAFITPQVYVGAELGGAFASPGIFRNYATKKAILLSPSIGYEMGHFDGTLRYELMAWGGQYLNTLGLRLAYQFDL
ncbi:hypothetical protein KHS38_01495 [Mucilaginibacter sp. Bleaf8]|uniref:hypothetical protein n=1 Tax=Mucilaginibacter sp. Bleaf8 TaxID=2834430 RepID=UPI001BD0DC7A|nr:hypothetical protein [Mucilaginibacter sp. Bleaf8]MBS7563065.1 hypothetical protein [Mucilaginibacter sp. Bleaf8]